MGIFSKAKSFIGGYKEKLKGSKYETVSDLYRKVMVDVSSDMNFLLPMTGFVSSVSADISNYFVRGADFWYTDVGRELSGIASGTPAEGLSDSATTIFRGASAAFLVMAYLSVRKNKKELDIILDMRKKLDWTPDFTDDCTYSDSFEEHKDIHKRVYVGSFVNKFITDLYDGQYSRRELKRLVKEKALFIGLVGGDNLIDAAKLYLSDSADDVRVFDKCMHVTHDDLMRAGSVYTGSKNIDVVAGLDVSAGSDDFGVYADFVRSSNVDSKMRNVAAWLGDDITNKNSHKIPGLITDSGVPKVYVPVDGQSKDGVIGVNLSPDFVGDSSELSDVVCVDLVPKSSPVDDSADGLYLEDDLERIISDAGMIRAGMIKSRDSNSQQPPKEM